MGNRLEDLAESLFGDMRDMTPEESKAMSDYISSISEPTGVNVFDIVDGKKTVLVTLEIDKVYRHVSKFDFEDVEDNE